MARPHYLRNVVEIIRETCWLTSGTLFIISAKTSVKSTVFNLVYYEVCFTIGFELMGE